MHLRVRALDGDARLHPRDDLEVSSRPTAILGSEARRHPKLDGREEAKVVRHDTDHGVLQAAETEHLADDAGSSAKTLLPEPMADDRDPWRARHVLGDRERTTERGFDAENREHFGRYVADLDRQRVC